jgi:AsmA protein
MRALRITAGVVAAVVVIAVLLLLIGFPAGFMTSTIASRVERETGFRLTIGGGTRISLRPSPNVTLDDVTLQQPGDQDTSLRVSVGRIQANMTLASLWSGRPKITNLVISHPVLSVPLLRQRSASAAAAAKQERSGGKDVGTLSIDRVTVTDGSIVLFNRHDHVEDHIEGVSANAIMGADRNVTVTGSAQANDQLLKFDIKATMPAAPLQAQNIPVDLKFEAPGLLQGPLTSTAQVQLNGTVLAINGVTGKLGDGTFNGWASIDLASKPQVKLDLDFQRLSVAMPTSRIATAPRPWRSNDPIELTGLNYVDLQARISAGQFNFGGLQIEPFSIEAALTNGILKSRFENLGVYGGKANGDLTIDASGNTPGYILHSDLAGIRALPLLQNVADFDKIDGKLQAKLALHSSGASRSAIMSNLDGTASLLFQDGAIRGINVAQMIRSLTSNPLSGWHSSPELSTDLAQLSASLEITRGQATTDDLNLVGPLVRVTGGGTIDLGQQMLALRVDPKLVLTTEGQGRTSEPVGLGIPVTINGSWDDPHIYPDVAGILDDPAAAYAKLKQLGKGLFGEKGTLNGLGGLLGGSGDGGRSDNGNDSSSGDSLGQDSLGQTLGTMIQQGLKQWRNFSAPSAPDQSDPRQ